MSFSEMDVPRAHLIASNLSSLTESLTQTQPRPHRLPSGDTTISRLAGLLAELMDLDQVMARGTRGAVKELEDHLRQTLETAVWHDR
jgi:hypothetical protein